MYYDKFKKAIAGLAQTMSELAYEAHNDQKALTNANSAITNSLRNEKLRLEAEVERLQNVEKLLEEVKAELANAKNRAEREHKTRLTAIDAVKNYVKKYGELKPEDCVQAYDYALQAIEDKSKGIIDGCYFLFEE